MATGSIRTPFTHCVICDTPVGAGGAYSVCVDPMWKENSWGGDSHHVVGRVCHWCGEKLRKASGCWADEPLEY